MAQQLRRPGARGGDEGQARQLLHEAQRGDGQARQLRGQPRVACRRRPRHRGRHREPQDQAGPLREGGKGRESPLHRGHQHLGHPDRRDLGQPGQGPQGAVPGHSLLQPAAVHEARGAHPRRGDEEGGHRLRESLLRGRARQGRRPVQGRAQLHRQPHRRLRHVQRHEPHARQGPEGRGHRRHHQRASGPAPLGHLRDDRPRGPRHGLPCHDEPLRGAARGREPRSLRPAGLRQGHDPEEVARQQDEGGLLQEVQGRQGQEGQARHRREDHRLRARRQAPVRVRRRGEEVRGPRREDREDGLQRKGRRGGTRARVSLQQLHLRRQPHPRDRGHRRGDRQRHEVGLQPRAGALRDLGRHRRQGGRRGHEAARQEGAREGRGDAQGAASLPSTRRRRTAPITTTSRRRTT